MDKSVKSALETLKRAVNAVRDFFISSTGYDIFYLRVDLWSCRYPLDYSQLLGLPFYNYWNEDTVFIGKQFTIPLCCGDLTRKIILHERHLY